MTGQKPFSFYYAGIHCTHTNTKPLLRDGKGFKRQLNKANGEQNTSHQPVDLKKST